MNEDDQEILIVDKDRFFANIYKELLEKEDYKTVLVEKVVKAIEVAQSKKPDLILLDFLVSDDIDSIDFIKKLEKNEKTKYIPIFMFTELGEKEDVDRAIEAGANRYLIKQHLSPKEVIEEINHFLNN